MRIRLGLAINSLRIRFGQRAALEMPTDPHVCASFRCGRARTCGTASQLAKGALAVAHPANTHPTVSCALFPAGPAASSAELAATTLRLRTRRSWWYGNCMARVSVLRVWRHQFAASVQVWGTSVGLGQGAEAGRKQAAPRQDGALGVDLVCLHGHEAHRQKGNKRWQSVGESEKRMLNATNQSSHL